MLSISPTLPGVSCPLKGRLMSGLELGDYWVSLMPVCGKGVPSSAPQTSLTRSVSQTEEGCWRRSE